MKKLKKVTTCVALAAGLLLSGLSVSAQAGTQTTVVVKDGLASSISPSYPNILGTITPSLQTVYAGSSQSYVVSSPYNNIASIHFTYSSGTKACRFDTSLTVINGIPNWTKDGTSTGSSYATCNAKITAIDMYTYNYTVEFTMR